MGEHRKFLFIGAVIGPTALVLCLMPGCEKGPKEGPKATTSRSAETRASDVMKHLLESHGFAKVEERGDSWTYQKESIVLRDLLPLLGLASADAFRPLPNSDGEHAAYYAEVSEDVFCNIQAPGMTQSRPAGDMAYKATVGITPPSERPSPVLKIGMPFGLAARSLSKAGAEDISGSTSDEIAQNPEKKRELKTYILRDGTWVQLVLDGNDKEKRILGILMCPRGKRYSDKREQVAEEHEVQEVRLDQ